jgi:hypothetical protein
MAMKPCSHNFPFQLNFLHTRCKFAQPKQHPHQVMFFYLAFLLIAINEKVFPLTPRAPRIFGDESK